MKTGDSIFYSKGFAILEKLDFHDSIPLAGFEAGDRATMATLKVYSFNKTSYTSRPWLVEKKGVFFAQPDTVISESIILQINSAGSGMANIGIKESNTVMEFVTLKAYKFPFINVLWAGIIITAIGIIISMVRRIRLNSSDSA